jgi:uncharacterized protein DUF3653
MGTRPPELYGININEVARICHVSIKTATRWKNGTTCPPKSARLLLLGDLGCLDDAWAGWVVRRGALISPEGWEIKLNDVLAVPLLRAQIEAYKTAERQILAIPSQPEIAEWPEWVFEKQA